MDDMKLNAFLLIKSLLSSKKLQLLLVSLCFILIHSCVKKPYATGPDIYVKDSNFKIVGYLGARGFKLLDQLQLTDLSYLNLAFANPNSDGELVFSGNADIRPVVEKGHEAGLKVFISLAGGGTPDADLWKSLLTRKNRTSFINHILEFVDDYDLDGVDVDIEWNLLPTLGDLYNPFIFELRDALHAQGKGITSALGATDLHEAIKQKTLLAFDFINVMVYDKTGIWRPEDVGPHSPYSYAEEAIQFWTVDKRVPADRITLGLPFYGFDFTPKARYISYKEIIEKDPSNAYRDSLDLTYYNGIQTIVRKTELAKKELGGVMIWEISLDVNSELSLLRAIDQTLEAGDCEVSTFFLDRDGDGFGDLRKPLQACSAPEGYVDNRDDADDSDPGMSYPD